MIKSGMGGFLRVSLMAVFSLAVGIQSAEGQAVLLNQGGASAREIAMGSAAAGMWAGTSSLFWNPAGLAQLENCELGLHQKFGLERGFQGIAAIGFPLPQVGGLAFSADLTDSGSFGGSGTADSGLDAGLGIQFAPNFALGFSGEFAFQSMPMNWNVATFAGAGGVLWSPVPNLNLGLEYSDFGFDADGRGLPQRFQAGFSLRSAWGKGFQGTVAGAWEYWSGGVQNYNAGAEILLGGFLALRGGGQIALSNTLLGRVPQKTFGVGVPLGRASLDFAFVSFASISHTLLFSATFPLSGNKREPGFVFKEIPFENDRTILTQEAKDALVEDAKILIDHPDIKVRVIGYSSSSAAPEHSPRLSEARASTVQDFLKNKGIPALRLIIGGEGRPMEGAPSSVEAHSDGAVAQHKVRLEITEPREDEAGHFSSPRGY